ncbi:MAG TPA: 30S ribosomal protein S2 [Candidatus Nanoarchaeia archaeon]|nr:30S ribosomal protein S2 [Candidatus Nanoarchaeia archaeon]
MTEQQDDFLVPTVHYLKSGIHIGTKFKTAYMKKFIYKTRPDGLSVLNIQKIDERLRFVARFLAQYEPQDILVVSRRENGSNALKLFQKLTSIPVIVGRYPPGMMTNINLVTFIEPKLVLVTDAWPDRNAVMDANKIGIPVVALCDTNNQSNFIDLVMPCNNKGKKSLGLLFYLLTVQYLKERGKITSAEELGVPMEEFTDK